MPAAAAKPVQKPLKTRKGGGVDQLAFWQDEPTAPEPVAKPKRRRAPAATHIPLPADPKASAVVGEEILAGRLHPGIWAMALARTSRGREEAEAEYARLRLISLQNEMASTRQKEHALEERRRAVFRKVPEAEPVGRKCNQRRKHPLPVLPLIALWLGTSAALAMVWRFAGGSSAAMPQGTDMAAHLALGALLAAVVWLIHEMVPAARRVIRQWVPVTSVLMASASMLGAVLVLKDAAAANLYGKAPQRNAPVSRPSAPANGGSSGEVKVSNQRVSTGGEF